MRRSAPGPCLMNHPRDQAVFNIKLPYVDFPAECTLLSTASQRVTALCCRQEHSVRCSIPKC